MSVTLLKLGGELLEVGAAMKTLYVATHYVAEGAGAAAWAAAWQERNRRAIERETHLLNELRATPALDPAMLSVALRELRTLG